jgi:hypothetical protein
MISINPPRGLLPKNEQTMRAYDHCNPYTGQGRDFWDLETMLIKKVAEGGYIMLNQFANDDITGKHTIKHRTRNME